SVRNRKGGVLAIDWDTLDGANDSVFGELTKLVRDFTSVLEVLITREENLFRDLENMIAESSDWHGAFEGVVEQLRHSLHASVCSLFLKHPGEEVLKLAASTSAKFERTPHQYDIGEGLTGWVAQHRNALCVRNARDPQELRKFDPPPVHVGRWKDIPNASAQGRLAFLGVPMLSRNQVIGVIRVSSNDETREFSPEEQEFLHDAGTRIARAIDAVWMEQHATRQIHAAQQQSAFHQ